MLPGGLAVVEMARASGIALVDGRNDPLRASTRGTGELIAVALRSGARRVIVGVGGSATTDGGLAAVETLGWSTNGIPITVACDVSTRFLDAARVFGPQKGATEAQVALLTRRLARLADEYQTRTGVDVRELAGSGAAGGLAGGLAAIGADLEPGFDVVADAAGLEDALDDVELVVTGEGKLDVTSFDGKTVGGVIEWAADAGVPARRGDRGSGHARGPRGARGARRRSGARAHRSRVARGRGVLAGGDARRGSRARGGAGGAGMIVWINGPFGVGKSTIATLLAERWPRATLFDPEHLGYLLRAWQPPDVVVADFQDLSVWRRLVRETVAGLLRDFHRPLIVPMTLLNPDYFDEIVGGLRADGVDVQHFCLTATREDVLARAVGRGDLGEWVPTKFDEHEPWLLDERFAWHIPTSGREPIDVLALLLNALRQ